MKTAKFRAKVTFFAALCMAVVQLDPDFALGKESLEFADKVISEHQVQEPGAARLRKILTSDSQLTRNIGTEDPNELTGPNNSWHPTSRGACIEKVVKTGLIKRNAEFEKICGAKWMAPVPDYAGQPLSEARVCIDQFEFPDMPCEYPVVWVTAATQKQICESMGKRVCNAHEWEGGCAGHLDSNDPYSFGYATKEQMRAHHNNNREISWAFQFISDLSQKKDTRALCGVYSDKDPEIAEPMRSNPHKYYAQAGQSTGCDPGGSPYKTCGSNTWPAGFKHQCRSSLGVYDMHGNVAETVNLPVRQDQIAKHSNPPGGLTEHKGSFFVHRPAYPDDCRVRQPYEHASSFQTNSMAFYQEGFRCCKDTKN